LCPVNGVFSLLARLAPFHYKVEEDAWRRSYKEGERGHRVIPVNCAPLVPLRAMEGAAACHMCGRCSGHRDAISLQWRSPSAEVVQLGAKQANSWDTALILYGLLGIAIGAFHWTVSPWFVALKQMCASWLIDQNILWPLDTNAPWFLLTHYPEQNDVFSWLDGGLVIGYIVATGIVYGTSLLGLLAGSTRTLGRFSFTRLHHLAQALIPIAGCGVFLGLSATTVSLLRAEHLPLGWVTFVRMGLLGVANLWSAWLAWRVIGKYSEGRVTSRCVAMLWFVAALTVVDSAWYFMFFGFSR